MYKNKKIAVVVPAYNEELQIVKVIETMPSWIDAIIIVDDCSTDQTYKIITQASKKDERIIPLHHDINQGVGGAIATGYKWARDHNFDAAVVMAGDAQMDPSDLPLLLDPVVNDEIDYAKANRLIYPNAYSLIPKSRFWGNSILSLFTKIASGYWHISDSQTGYTVINSRALHTIDWDQMYKRYGQPNDLLVKLNVFNFRVRDIPLKPVYNVGETSKLKIRKVVFTLSFLLVKLFFWRLKQKYIIRDFHPLIFFYYFGFMWLFLFFGFFIRFCDCWTMNSAIPHIALILTLFSLAIGTQSLFFGMWFDQENNKNLR